MPINIYADEIETPVLLIHGEKAHSRYFSEDVYKKMKGNNKELLIIPGAVHTDLYDHMDVIPFAKIAAGIGLRRVLRGRNMIKPYSYEKPYDLADARERR